MVVRTYFDKNNTMVYNSTINTARNPVTELYYGGNLGDLEYSRFIFHFDETRLRELYSGGTFPDLTKMKHVIRMTNTGHFDDSLLNTEEARGKERTSSFDLILFKVNQEWDEGTGYDYFGHADYLFETSASNRPSNWIYPTSSLTGWANGGGVYSDNPSGITITTQHFDWGNENIEMDVTDYVNNIITGDTNYGLGIAFSYNLENTSTDELQYVGFFTRHSQTAYEPFLETVYSNTITDNRSRFYADKNNKLYLYVNAGGVPTNLDTKPSVVVRDASDDIFATYEPSAVTHVTKGVYCIDINIPSNSNYSECTMFTDTWSGLVINGVNLRDVELEFIMNINGFYNIGTTEELPKNYGFSVRGLKRDERIVRGDIRKVIVSARVPYTVNQQDILDTLEYRLYVKEGPNEYTIIDYQPLEMAYDQNYFLLDTESLLPNTYWLDLKLTTNREVRTIKDVVNFDIVSLVELRNNTK